jgi:hypothetical protein
VCPLSQRRDASLGCCNRRGGRADESILNKKSIESRRTRQGVVVLLGNEQRLTVHHLKEPSCCEMLLK